MEENHALALQFLFSRLPLCDGGLDKVVGVIRTNEFLEAQHNGADSTILLLLAQPPVFVPETVSLDHLLETQDWKLTYLDHTSLVFRRDTTEAWQPERLQALRQRLVT